MYSFVHSFIHSLFIIRVVIIIIIIIMIMNLSSVQCFMNNKIRRPSIDSTSAMANNHPIFAVIYFHRHCVVENIFRWKCDFLERFYPYAQYIMTKIQNGYHSAILSRIEPKTEMILLWHCP